MLKTKLMPHQQTVLNFIKDKKYFGIFCDYGTGKTLMALAFINMYQIRKVLVVSTKTAVESTWPTQIREHTDFKYVALTGDGITKKKRLTNLYLGLRKSMLNEDYYHSSVSSVTLFLINFDGVKSIYPDLVKAGFDLILLDESTKIKSPTTQRTKVLWSLSRQIPNRGIMNGFPVTENLVDIYSQIKFLDNGQNLASSYYAFTNNYFVKTGYKYVPKKKGISTILNKIRPFCISLPKDIIKLPPQVYKRIYVKYTPIQKKLIDKLNSEFRLEFGKVKIDTEYIFTLLGKSLQICDGFIQHIDLETKIKTVEAVPTYKDEALLDIIDEIDVTKNKVLIWFNFQYSLEKIAKILTKLGHKVLTLYGKTKNASQVVSKFQHTNCNILLATQKKAAESITLTSCQYAIYYSNNWSSDLRLNSEARIRRKGSEKFSSIIYTDLYVKDSIEEHMLQSLKNKKSLIESLKTEFRGG